LKVRKYRAPSTIKELKRQSSLRELSDYLIDPKSKITDAIVICMNKDGFITFDVTDNLETVKTLGMIEFAKGIIFDVDKAGEY
jgi:hypothetical protein